MPRGRTAIPSGDVLIQQNVFYGSKLDLRSKEAAQLMALTEQAKEKGYEITRRRPSPCPRTWARSTTCGTTPTNYADFLTAEIQSVSTAGARSSWMPSGLGIWWRESEFADKSRPILDELGGQGEDPTAVMPLAMDAIVKLDGRAGHRVDDPGRRSAARRRQADPASHSRAEARTHPRRRLPKPTPPGASWMFALPVLLVVLAAAVVIVRRRLSSDA